MSIPTTYIPDRKGKFSDNVDEAVWDITLDGCCDECGDTETIGHFALVTFDAAERAALAALRDEDNDPVFVPAPAAAIVETMSSGAVDVSYFDTEEEARERWARIEHEDMLARGPQEEDITTGDHRRFYVVGARNKPYLTVPEGADYRAALRAQMELDGFFPNVWFVSDHGNAHLIDLERN